MLMLIAFDPKGLSVLCLQATTGGKNKFSCTVTLDIATTPTAKTACGSQRSGGGARVGGGELKRIIGRMRPPCPRKASGRERFCIVKEVEEGGEGGGQRDAEEGKKGERMILEG